MTFKVANVICRFNSGSGGPPRVVVSIAVAGSGHWRAELFTTDFVEPGVDSLLTEYFPGDVHLLDRKFQSGIGGLMMAARLARPPRNIILQGGKPDLLHLHGVWSPYLAAFAADARANQIPYIVAPHGMLEPWPLRVHRLRKWLALKSYQGSVLTHAAAIHATSRAEADQLRTLGFTRAPVVVVPNIIDMPARDLNGDRWSSKERKTLLFLSRVDAKKGLDMLLRAWDHLRPRDWQLLIVGHGEPAYVNRLKRYCAERQLPNVRFHGHVDGDEREAMFERASAFILPTFSENFGNAVGEALMRGLPVITTTGTPWQIVSDEKLGWYVAPRLDQLTDALRELFATQISALRDMGERGTEYARATLTLEALRPRIRAMYELALRRP
jgi:glycosyltransferase involved in cell wall biosynthesis